MLLAGAMAAGAILAPRESHAQEPAAGASVINVPPLGEAADNIVPGLTLTFESGEAKDVRVARLVALTVPEKTPPTPFLAPGPFRARWEGNLNLSLRGEYEFSALCAGNLRVTINGNPVLELTPGAAGNDAPKALRLKKGINAIVAEYESPAKGDAFVRLYWKGREFPREPVPPTVFTHNESSEPERLAQRIREGRALVGTLRCLKCHDAGDLAPDEEKGLPELALDAPSFADIGSRLKATWMAEWISDPHAIRADAVMPQVFTGGAAGIVDARAADIAAYLAALGAPAAREAAEAPAAAALHGGKLFATLGCIACHSLPDAAPEADEHRRVSLRHVQAKWQSTALQEYLRAPEKHYAWNPMPNFRLNEAEAAQLTAFLFAGTADGAVPADKTYDVESGRKLVETSGCLNCHAAPGATSSLKAPTLAETMPGGWTRGCLGTSEAARGRAPDFKLPAAARAALMAFAATGFASLKQETLPEFAERQMAALRCTSCHARDGQQDAWSKLESETVQLIMAAPAPAPAAEAAEGAGGEQSATTFQAPPQLTWVGEKLHPGWSAEFIGGKTRDKPRDWMLARMPGFPMPAAGIAAGLSLQHGFPLARDSEPPIDAAVAEVGQRLLGAEAGYSCTTCHGLDEQAASAPFEAPAINFQYVGTRLREEYYHRWMLNPPRIEPDTRMPKFADEEGKTPLTDVYEGDASRQWDAIWEFLRSLQIASPDAK